MPTVQTNGIDTYYEEYGEGPPIVFIHGATSNHQLWVEQAQPLTDEYRVIAYDVRGHGLTGATDTDTYTVELYADDLAAFVDALDLDDPILCGLSMGGMILQEYAARDGASLSGAVLIGTFTPEVFSRREWVERYAVTKLMTPIISYDWAMNGLRRIQELLYGEETAGDMDKREAIMEGHPDDIPEMPGSERAKIMESSGEFSSMTIDYSEIGVPTLVMYGERELDTAAKHAEYLGSQIPTAETREIPDAGHNSHVDNPSFIIESIREFLETRVDETSETPQKPS